MSALEKSPVYLRTRHLWPNLVQDILCADMPGARPIPYSAIAEAYDMSMAELAVLVQLPAFKQLFNEERARAKALGAQAGHKFRAEAIFRDLTETIYKRLRDPKTDTKEVLAGYKLMGEIAGILTDKKAAAEAQQAVTVQTGIAIQITLPQEAGDKFSELRVRANAIPLQADTDGESVS